MKPRYTFPDINNVPPPVPPWKVWENFEDAKEKKKRDDQDRVLLLEWKKRTGVAFSQEDLRFLYGVDGMIQGFKDDTEYIYWTDFLRTGRDVKKDIAGILGISEREVGISEEDIWSGECRVFPDNIMQVDIKSIEHGILPEQVWDNLSLMALESAETLILPRRVNKGLELGSLKSNKGVIFPEYVGGSMELSFDMVLEEALYCPKEIGGSIKISHFRNAKDGTLPEKVGGDLELPDLNNAEGVLFPKRVGGSLDIPMIRHTKGLVLPEYIGGSLQLFGLSSLDGLDVLESRTPEHFRRMFSQNFLQFPLYIGGNIDLRHLINPQGLIPPEKFQGKIIFEKMDPENIRKFKKKYPDITVVTHKGYGNETQETIW